MREIASLRNPAVQRYRRLRDAGERRASGLAAAEGVRVLREALLSEAGLVDVFLGERVLGQAEAGDLVERLEAGAAAGHWRCFRVGDELLARMAHTESAQGALAVFRPRTHAVGDLLRGEGTLLLLERLADPGNLGLILRTAEAAGGAGVVLSPGSVDHLNPKCVRASAGSVFRLPVARAGIAAAATAALEAGYRLFATSPREGEDHVRAPLGGKVGFFLGQEGAGLSPELLARFRPVHVPTGRVESLNVAMAAGLLLYEARRQRRAAG